MRIRHWSSSDVRREVKINIKTIKMLEEPTLEDLIAELQILHAWLPQVLSPAGWTPIKRQILEGPFSAVSNPTLATKLLHTQSVLFLEKVYFFPTIVVVDFLKESDVKDSSCLSFSTWIWAEAWSRSWCMRITSTFLWSPTKTYVNTTRFSWLLNRREQRHFGGGAEVPCRLRLSGAHLQCWWYSNSKSQLFSY